MFFTDDFAFSCTKPANIYTFQESLGFSQNSHKECRTGHVLRELHRFLERNNKHAEQKKQKNIQNKKHAEQKKKHSYHVCIVDIGSSRSQG